MLPSQDDQWETWGRSGDGNEWGSHSQVANSWLGLELSTQGTDTLLTWLCAREGCRANQPSCCLWNYQRIFHWASFCAQTLTYAWMHTPLHTYTHTYTECELIPGKGLLVWATTDVLWCIGYMTYKITTKYFVFGTEKWTASRGKTVSLSPAINWLWCLILKFSMCSSPRYVCEWREMSGKAISNMCSLKCWSAATTYIFVFQLLSLLSRIHFRENKKNYEYSVFSYFPEFHSTHDIDLALVTMKFSRFHFLEL